MMGEENKIRLKIIKSTYHFHYEGNMLAETLNAAHGISGFRGTQFEHRLPNLDRPLPVNAFINGLRD